MSSLKEVLGLGTVMDFGQNVSGMRGAYLGSRSFLINALRRNRRSATISCAKTRGQGTPFQALLTSRALIIGADVWWWSWRRRVAVWDGVRLAFTPVFGQLAMLASVSYCR